MKRADFEGININFCSKVVWRASINNQSRFTAPKTKRKLIVRTEAEFISECDIDTLDTLILTWAVSWVSAPLGRSHILKEKYTFILVFITKPSTWATMKTYTHIDNIFTEQKFGKIPNKKKFDRRHKVILLTVNQLFNMFLDFYFKWLYLITV
jgi:hypothetical protein